MTNKVKEISVSYSWTSAGAATAPAPQLAPQDRLLWAFPRTDAVPLPGGRILLRERNDRARVVTTPDVLAALQHCRVYRTLEEHVAVVQRSVPALAKKSSQLLPILRELAQRGLFVSAEAVAGRFRDEPPVATVAPVYGIFVRTCDRPDLLGRLLKSLAENERRYAAGFRHLILDDSRSPENQRQNRALVENLQRSGALLVEYVGRVEQQAFADSLSRNFPQHRTELAWLLRGNEQTAFSGGALWNQALLMAAGRRFFLIDDDVICQARKMPGNGEDFALSNAAADVHAFASREDMLAQTEVLVDDPFAVHLKVLGTNLGQIIHGWLPGGAWAQLLHHFEADAAGKLQPGSPVLLSQCGVLGDPGTPTAEWLYQLRNDERARFVSDENTFRQLRNSRSLWIGTSAVRVRSESSLLATLRGFDNSRLLPPTGPNARNEDTLFGTLLRYAYPGAMFIELPWGLPHFPEQERRFDARTLDRPAIVGLHGFLADIAKNTANQCLLDDPAGRLRYLGQTYTMLAAAADSDLESALVENRLHACAQRANHLQAELDTFNAQPTYWADDIRRMLAADSKLLTDVGADLIGKAEGGESRAGQVSTVRTTFDRLGSVLSFWPALWEYCRQRNDTQGDRGEYGKP